MKRFTLVLAACTPLAGQSQQPAWVADTSSYGGSKTPVSVPRNSVADTYRDVADKIIAAARADRGAYQKLAELTDKIGHRLSGSPNLDRAIEWAARVMKADGHVVRTEPVMVPVWVRGTEDVAITTPVARPLRVLGLGGSVSTPRGGITAPVIVVRSFDELDAKAADVKGKIVLYDVAMPPWNEKTGSGYGEVVRYRGRGASRAAKHGAVGVLVRSATAHSLRTPHTGAMRYEQDLPKIPAAAVTVEDSMLLARFAAQGPVTVKMQLESKTLPDVRSANVVGEIVGRERPDEVVVIGAHLDSWDVGQGAHDDGAGCVTMMQAITVLRQLRLAPRRTIRVVLFTNEENGLRGATSYAKEHADELPKTVFAVEADSGGFAPMGFSVETKPEVSERVVARIASIASLLAPINATLVRAGYGGADLSPLVPAGVPTAGLMVDSRTYFDIHHTEADTLDKVDPAAVADMVAAMAVMAYVVADMPGRVDDP